MNNSSNALRTNPQEPLTFIQTAAYAMVALPVYMLMIPMNIIQGIYAKYYGLALTTLAGIILLSRVIDALSDPIIGHLSDRFRARYGSRKPFVIAGSVMLMISGYFLYVPMGEVSALYAGFWIIALYISYTLFDIPHLTWPSDIATHSDEKAKLYSFRAFAGFGGLFLFYCIPLLPIFELNEITPQTLKATYFLIVLFVLPFLIQAVRVVPDGRHTQVSVEVPLDGNRHTKFMESLKEVSANTPFLIFVLAFIFAGFAIGMWHGLIYIYVDVYLDMADQYALMSLISLAFALASIPVWHWLVLTIGKKRVWVFAIVLLILSFVCTGFIEQGTAAFAQLVALKALQDSGFACLNIVIPTMLSEIIDYSQLKSGTENRATYFSIRVFIDKTNLAAGMGVGLAIVGTWGLDVAASEHSEASLVVLKFASSWVPAAIGMLAFIFIIMSPLDERRHRIIRRRLDANFPRAKRQDEDANPFGSKQPEKESQ